MKYDESYEMLIEYAEGTLSAERKRELEAMLKHSPELQQDLELIQSAFQGLSDIPLEKTPEHYFTNFLPRLRQKIDSEERYSYWHIPRLIQSFLAPMVAVAIIFSLVGIYQSFKPEEIQSPIYSLVNQLEQDDLTMIGAERSNFESIAGIINGTETIINDGTDIDMVNLKINEDLLSSDYLPYQTESELVGQLEEQEIEQVIERLTKPAIL